MHYPILAANLKKTGWAISSGFDRTDVNSVADLKGGTIGVSRLGSGSYVMGFVLADQQGWLSSSTAVAQPYSNTAILHTFENLRKAVNSGAADFFMWEHFTSKRYYDSQEIKRVGEIYTPWSSWKIVASTKLAGGDGALESRVEDLFGKLDQGIQYFNDNADEAVAYISTELDYSEEDAKEWIKTVRFPKHTEGVSLDTIEGCVRILRKAGVLSEGKGMAPGTMIIQKK